MKLLSQQVKKAAKFVDDYFFVEGDEEGEEVRPHFYGSLAFGIAVVVCVYTMILLERGSNNECKQSFDANFTLKKAKVLQEELTGDFFMKLELKSFEEVNGHWYVESYNRSSMYAHITGDYLEQLEKTLKELKNLLIAEKKQIKEKAERKGENTCNK